MSAELDAQRQLQAEADLVVHALDLDSVLGALGTPVRVGSSAMGLMVARDIDMTVVCPTLDAATLNAVSDIAAGLMRHPWVSAVRFRNDCGAWNIEPDKYPDGLYLGVTVRDASGAIWNLDIWAVDDAARQPDLAHLRTLLPRIEERHRQSILQIKRALAARAGDRGPSIHVYEAVLDHGVQTVEQFDRWRQTIGSPVAAGS